MKKKIKRWSPPPEWSAPVDAEQFKFCLSLMAAAASGQMTVPTPNPLTIEGVGEVSVTNTPFNRGMLAVGKHLHDVYPHGFDDPVPAPAFAMLFRLRSFTDFLHDCLAGKHPRSKEFVILEGTRGFSIHESLIEAAATAKVGERRGFFPDSIFKIAAQLAKDSAAA
jgi:hypothetical protein